MQLHVHPARECSFAFGPHALRENRIFSDVESERIFDGTARSIVNKSRVHRREY
jgi:hypothetical protein